MGKTSSPLNCWLCWPKKCKPYVTARFCTPVQKRYLVLLDMYILALLRFCKLAARLLEERILAGRFADRVVLAVRFREPCAVQCLPHPALMVVDGREVAGG